MGTTLPTVPVLPSVSSQPIKQASLTVPAQYNLPVLPAASASHTEILPPSEAAEHIAPTLPSVSASPICVSATRTLPTVPALPTGPKLPTVPSPATEAALPGISPQWHYEPVPFIEPVTHTVPAPSTMPIAATAPMPAHTSMPSTNIPITVVPSIKPSSPIEAAPPAVLASPPVLVCTNTTTALPSTVLIPPALASCCVDGDQGFSCQIVVYKMNGMTPYSVKENKKSLVKAIAEGSDEEVAAALMQDPEIKKFVFEELVRSLDDECENLCKPSTQSMLRQKTVEQLSSFSWEKFVDEEVKEKAPILHKIAVTVACTRVATSRNVRKTFARKIPAMGMALACLLKARNQNMSAAQVLNSLILTKGHLTDMVCTQQFHLLCCDNQKVHYICNSHIKLYTHTLFQLKLKKINTSVN